MVHYISFPQIFDKVFTVPQEAFLGIRWYAIMIMSGFLLAALYAMKRSKEFNTNSDRVADLLLWALPISLIGARIYYVAHNWSYFSQNLGDIIKIWEGGIAIYGAVIAGFITVCVFGKITKMDILSFLDLGALGLLIGQAIGRWGNFFNAEAFGTATDSMFGMVIRKSVMDVGTPVHPAFLYESVWNAVGFFILHFYSKRRKFKGEIFLMYTAWYGFGRFFIEGLRTDSLMIGETGIRTSQVFAAITCIAAVLLLIYCYVSKKYIPVNHMAQEPINAAVGDAVIVETFTDVDAAQMSSVTNLQEVDGQEQGVISEQKEPKEPEFEEKI